LNKYILDIPVPFTIAILLFLIACNTGAAFRIAKHVLATFEAGRPPEVALNQLRKWNQHGLTYLNILSMLAIVYLLWPLLLNLGMFGKISLIASPMAVLLLFTAINQFFFHRVQTIVRGTTETYPQQLATIVRFFVIIAIVSASASLLPFIPHKFIKGLHIPDFLVLGFIFPCALILLIQIVIPLVQPKMLKAQEMADTELCARLSRLIDRARIGRFRLLQWPTRHSKIANAFVVGLFRKNFQQKMDQASG